MAYSRELAPPSTPPRLITFHYVLKDALGNVIDSSYNGRPITILEGQHHLVAGLERTLLKLRPGDRKSILIPAADAYGIYDETLVLSLPREEIDEEKDLEVGRTFRVGTHGKEARTYSVTSITNSKVTLDGNHPLAGKDLIFDLELVRRKKPTDSEVAGGFTPVPGQHLH